MRIEKHKGDFSHKKKSDYVHKKKEDLLIDLLGIPDTLKTLSRKRIITQHITLRHNEFELGNIHLSVLKKAKSILEGRCVPEGLVIQIDKL